MILSRSHRRFLKMVNKTLNSCIDICVFGLVGVIQDKLMYFSTILNIIKHITLQPSTFQRFITLKQTIAISWKSSFHILGSNVPLSWLDKTMVKKGSIMQTLKMDEKKKICEPLNMF